MSYDNPSKRETYYLPSAAFGATTDSLAIKGPAGKKGTVKDIRQYVTATMVGTTTVPEIDVGSAISAVGAGLKTEYARFRLGTTAIAGYASANTPFRARALCDAAAGNPGGAAPSLSDYAGHIALETAKIPADTIVFITRLLGVGGTPAGTGPTEVDIDWD